MQLSWAAAAISLVVWAATMHRPIDGVLMIAGLLPLATLLGLLVAPPISGPQCGEFLLLSFLSGATARYVWQPPGLTRVLAGATLASGIAIGAALMNSRTATLAMTGARYWVEAAVLAYVAAVAVRRTPDGLQRVSRMLVIGVAAASLATVNRLGEIWLRNQLSLADAIEALRPARIGIHFADINAVGSFYALFVVPACWLAWTRRGGAAWIACLAILNALWWTGSRAAVVAACCGLLIVAWRRVAFTWRSGVLAVTAAAAIVTSAMVTADRPLSSIDALRIRVDMAEAGLRLAVAHPWLGVGPGQFAAASRPLISNDVAMRFPRAANGENAHNNFVQIVAEFGIAGGGMLTLLLLIPLAAGWAALAGDSTAPELPALVGGIVAFLITCLFGHPLLTPQCLWLFLFVLGLVAGAVDSQTRGTPVRVPPSCR